MPAVSTIVLAGAIGAGLYAHEDSKKQAKRAAKKAEEALPKPDPPIVQGKEGDATQSRTRKFIKSGRGGSILAGSLTPKNIGKQTLG